MGACTVPGNLMIVSEFMPRGNLEEMLQNPQIGLSLLTRMKMARDAALGMTWLHGSTPQFIHRDLKTSNLLVDDNMNIKLCDFGLSEIKSQGENLVDGVEGAKGTPLWMAPEVLAGKSFNEKADIYSFGIVLWEILTRKEPFEEFESFEEFRAAVCMHHIRPPIPPNTLPRLASLIEACWQPDPQHRPTFDQIVAQLDHVIIEVAIKDEVGRKLWKRCFLKKFHVPWAEFVEEFLQLLKQYNYPPNEILPAQISHSMIQSASTWQLREFSTRSVSNANLVREEFERREHAGLMDPMEQEGDHETEVKCLQAILMQKDERSEGMSGSNEGVVGMERFGQILEWFGPIVDPGSNQVVMMRAVRELLSQEWFHGDITTAQAETQLNRRDPGTFLVRFSTLVGHYTISRACEDRITHQRVLQDKPGFLYNNERYESLVELVKAAAPELGLEHACPGSRFAYLFSNPTASTYVLQSGYQFMPGSSANY
eukprot:TRINITY_DN1974_c0_g3_i4.p1 TRINITY_DN1974_c0_g3~~TRINITY_DN1974_c0_g3_i4.p1  ORF type:complete len:483 (-),score=174.14 TRINITY_DN1974_c0_g3_i4:1872-3320(-)